MQPDVHHNLTKSAEDFRRIVWPDPRVSRACGGGRLIQVETLGDNEVCAWLDMSTGIDALAVTPGRTRGLACRVQWGFDFRTFTIRYISARGGETELAKRKEQFARPPSDGDIRAELFIQAYVSRDRTRVTHAGVVRYRDLIAYAVENEHKLRRLRAPDGNVALIVPWADLRAADIKVIVIDGTAAVAA